MARIRTIKPEFPQSESMGRVSRDARLTFIQLWTLADDSGRLRGNKKMLASLLFPYDDDAPSLIEGWLSELEEEGCIVQYKVDRQSYVQITNWETHQKIDKPTPSKIPSPTGVKETPYSEQEIENILFDYLKNRKEVFGNKILDLQKKVRVGSSYLNLVVQTEGPKYILELKKGLLTASDLKQVLSYATTTKGEPVLIGGGLSPTFPTEEAKEKDVAVLSFSGPKVLKVLIESTNVKYCSIMLASATECSGLDQGSRIKEGIKDQGIDQGKDQGKNQEKSVVFQEIPDPGNLRQRADLFFETWDKYKLPPWRKTMLNVGGQDAQEVITALKAFTQDELFEALKNYASLYQDQELYEPRKFATPIGFLKTGIGPHLNQSRPLEVFKRKKTGSQQISEEEAVRIAKESLARVAQ